MSAVRVKMNAVSYAKRYSYVRIILAGIYGSMHVQRIHAINDSHHRVHGPVKVGPHAQPISHAPSGGALSSSVLVLNRLYIAVHVINVRRAFCLLYREMAEVIHLEHGQYANYTFQTWQELSELRADEKQPNEDWIRAVGFEIQAPRVIRLLRFDRLPKQQLHLNRRNILARDEHTCQYCGKRYPTHQLSLDHINPRSRGGETTWENVVCACLSCNIEKGGRTPHEARMKLVRRPTRPKRNPMLALKLSNPKYESWRTWLDGVCWEIGARD
jgi:5-methylcytosine-specific restriction endonuclease McrA